MTENRARNAFIKEMEDNIHPPQDIRAQMEQWEGLRQYVHTATSYKDTMDTAVTNYILRAQQTVVTNSMPRDPIIRVTPTDWIPEQDSSDPATQQMALEDGNPFNIYDPAWLNYTKSQEIIVNKQIKQSSLLPTLRGMVQDSLTLPVAWVKVRWIEDTTKDPLGMPYDSSENEMAIRYKSMKEDYDNKAFTKDDSRYFELQEMNEAIKGQKSEQITLSLAEQPAEPVTDALGNPIAPDHRQERLEELQSDSLIDADEVHVLPIYRAPVIESVDAEDVRFDWLVQRPEDMPKARWMSHRIFMMPEEANDQLAMSDQEKEDMDKYASLFDSKGQAITDSELERWRGTEINQNRGFLVCVNEYWDRLKKRRYTWVEGCDTLLEDIHEPNLPRRFFPFFPLFRNRVTGQIFAPSDVQLQTPLQEELNMLHTHDSEARKSAYPRWMVGMGLLSPKAKSDFRKCKPYGLIETDRVDDIAKSIHPLVPQQYNPMLYDGSRARNDFELISRMPSSAMGATGNAKFATSDAIANQQMGMMSNDLKEQVMDLIQSIAEYLMQMNAMHLGVVNAKELAGPGSDWLGGSLDRLAVIDNFNIELDALPSTDAEMNQAMAIEERLASMTAQLGLPIQRVKFLTNMIRLSGKKGNISDYVDIMQLLDPPEQAAGQQGSTENPEDQGDQGAQGGRPETTAETDITPESIPNNPIA